MGERVVIGSNHTTADLESKDRNRLIRPAGSNERKANWADFSKVFVTIRGGMRSPEGYLISLDAKRFPNRHLIRRSRSVPNDGNLDYLVLVRIQKPAVPAYRIQDNLLY